MFNKGKKILILGVLFTVLLYAEGEQESSTGTAPKESEISVKEEKRKTPVARENESHNQVEQVTKRSTTKYSENNNKKSKSTKFEGNTVTKKETLPHNKVNENKRSNKVYCNY